MVKSPCIKDCNFDEVTNTCLGCRRTVEEFRNWRGMTDEEKQDVILRIQREKQCHIEKS
jgi:predicted Fe-S protein YdhL (DUF1289 family)